MFERKNAKVNCTISLVLVSDLLESVDSMKNQETAYSLQIVPEAIKLQRRYKYELAADYEVSNATFYNMLKAANLSVGRGKITAQKQLEIFSALGFPECYMRLTA